MQNPSESDYLPSIKFLIVYPACYGTGRPLVAMCPLSTASRVVAGIPVSGWYSMRFQLYLPKFHNIQFSTAHPYLAFTFQITTVTARYLKRCVDV